MASNPAKRSRPEPGNVGTGRVEKVVTTGNAARSNATQSSADKLFQNELCGFAVPFMGIEVTETLYPIRG